MPRPTPRASFTTPTISCGLRWAGASSCGSRARSYADLESEGYVLPVTEVSARYLSPCRYGDVVTVRTRGGACGAAR